VIRPPEAPSVFISFLDSQVNQQVSSAFFVLDLIGRNATLECKRNARGFVHPELNHRKETVGLIGGNEG
jgi:hypothetical protein